MLFCLGMMHTCRVLEREVLALASLIISHSENKRAYAMLIHVILLAIVIYVAHWLKKLNSKYLGASAAALLLGAKSYLE